jgi:hypothetical protein
VPTALPARGAGHTVGEDGPRGETRWKDGVAWRAKGGTMRIAKVLAAVIGLVAFGASARAQDDLTVHRRSAAGTMLRDTISGGILGAAVSGGIIGYEMGVQNHSDYNWQRTLAIGAGIGLGVGLIWGILDTTSGNYSMTAPLPARDGLSMSLDVRRVDQSGRAEIPIAMGRF